jgi:hypothetical protein
MCSIHAISYFPGPDAPPPSGIAGLLLEPEVPVPMLPEFELPEVPDPMLPELPEVPLEEPDARPDVLLEPDEPLAPLMPLVPLDPLVLPAPVGPELPVVELSDAPLVLEPELPELPELRLELVSPEEPAAAAGRSDESF